SLYCGATVKLLTPPVAPEVVIAEARSWRPSVMLLVPTLLRRLLELPDQEEPMLPGLRVLACTGAVLHPDERRQVLTRISPRLMNFYGSTEGGGLSLLLPEHQGVAAQSVGQPVFGTDVEIVDQDNQPLPAGSVGRIRYRGPSVAIGFYKNPEASAEAFADGWFLPGDLGRLDEDGFLYLAGRAKDMIVRGGVNVYPEEIEQVLCGHASVTDAAVVAWPSSDLGEEIAAYVVTTSGVDEGALLDHCRGHLAPYKVPRAIFFIQELPRSSVGKVRKDQLARGLPPAPGRSD
ncbi:MAG: class I adenylate-forming enzyme family protein, partial [Planctomycetota bacterium]